MLLRSFLVLSGILCVLLPACKKDVLHWQAVQRLDSHTTGRLNNIRFIGDSICVAAGGVIYERSDILRSADGGYTWTAITNSDAPKEMYGMSISPQGVIYLCGVDGDVLHSADSGSSWQFNRINNWLVNFGGGFSTPDTGIFVNSVLQRQSTITRVDASFHIIDEQTYPFGLNKIYMLNPTTGYVIGYGAVMKTVDKGDTWTFQDVNGDNFTAMDIHRNEIWMCGSNGGIYYSNNGGEKWKRLRNGNDITLPRYMLRCILFTDAVHGWACGDDGVVLYSSDGGKHWVEYEHFTTSALRSIAICPNGDLLMAGDNGALYRIIPG